MPSRKTRAWLDGIEYRSHTEYRWAVFFKEIDIGAKYETQGFVTDDEPYLPDFSALPALGRLWIEVKGDWEDDPEGVARWRRWAAQRPQPSRTVLLSGDPAIEAKCIVIGGDEDATDPFKGPWEDDTMQWRPCASGRHFDLCYPGLFRAKFVEDGCTDNFGGNGEERLRKAVEAALSHRFGKASRKKAA